MKLKRMFLLAAVVCSTFAAIAQSTMTDIQVLEYVKSGLAQGKSQEVMMRELAARGVDRAQAERVREMYESQKTAVAQEIATTADDRAHTVASEVDITPEAFDEDSQGPMVYGRDVFRNKSLNFAPSENLATPKNYRLGPGDEVIIDIFGANQVTLRNKISPEGSINVDVLGPLYLSGMTIEEANKYLKRKLAGIYGGLNRSSAGTDIRLSLGQIRSIQVNVLGDVNHAGTYVVSAFSTVFRLEEGDVVMVKPYTCLVKIGGEVKRPMYFEMKDGESLQDLIDYAGGFAGGAYTDNVTVVRQHGRNYEVRTVDAADFKGFKMQNGDEVTVSQLNSYYENKLTISGAVYQPGTYEFGGEVKTVRQLVAKAGGVLPDAFLNRAVLHREHDDKTLEVISVNLGKVLSGEATDIVLQKNDELYVTSISDLRETGTMAISGMVANPGIFPFARNTTVEDLIIMAGGLREGASLARVDIARRKRDANGLVQSDEVGELISISLKDGFVDDGGDKFYLQPYDEVTVHRSPSYNVQTHVTLTGEANFPGSFTMTSRNERLSDLVKKAGGVTNYAYVKGARLFRNMSDEERRQVTDILLFHSGDNSQVDTTAIMRMASQYQVAIDLDKAIARPGSEFDIELVEGDILDIPVIHNTVRVMGEVMIPSVLSYEPRHRGDDYIDACGGFGPDARRAKKYVIHMNGRSEKLKGGTKILPGDQIIVPAKKKRDGVADQTFARIATMSTTVASLGTTAATLYMLIMRNKNN